MKLVTYLVKETELTIREQMAASRVGWLQGGWIVDIGFAQEWATLNKGIPITRVLPVDMLGLLEAETEGRQILNQVAATADRAAAAAVRTAARATAVEAAVRKAAR